MNTKEDALIRYLEFNLIGLVNSISPHLKDDTDMEEIYGMADAVLEEMRDAVTQPTGITSESPH